MFKVIKELKEILPTSTFVLLVIFFVGSMITLLGYIALIICHCLGVG